jgi:hypothetical protein
MFETLSNTMPDVVSCMTGTNEALEKAA